MDTKNTWKENQFGNELTGRYSKHSWMFISKGTIAVVIRIIYIFLFAYTGLSKLMDIARFIRVIQKTSLFGIFTIPIGWGIPILEIFLALLMAFSNRKTVKISMMIAVVCMVVFTSYLILMLLFMEHRMCNCGGVIESLNWTEHLVFNIAVLLMGIWFLKINKSI